MTYYWFAQSVGVVAFVVGITMFFNRNDRRFKQQLSAYSAIIGVHFLMMGAAPAGMSALLNSLRTLISLRTRNQWIMVVFIVLTLVLGLSHDTIGWNYCPSAPPSSVPGRCFAPAG